MSFPPMGDEFYLYHPERFIKENERDMKTQLGKQTGIALALLATMLATLFAMGVFSVAQAQATSPSADRSFFPN